MKRSTLRLAGALLLTALAACAPRAPATAYPLLFVTQVALHEDHASRLSAFANHLGTPESAPRGGDLMLRYPDGRLRNLTLEAGFEQVAVREPSVHWDGRKALFSMLVGAARTWQIYEVSGLGENEALAIVRLVHQPDGYNNLSPLYDAGERVLFTSDRPRGGQAQLYPQLDEYEATPSVTGIWRLDPASGALTMLNHTPSGAFSPAIDSYGRIVFTRWDHQQQDQLAERDRNAEHNRVGLPFKSFNYSGEDAAAPALDSREEVFPESRAGEHGRYGEVSAFTTNFFTAWTMEQDGTGEETLDHVGQHELAFGYLTPSFRDDPNLSNHTREANHANRLALRREGGLFQLREDARRPGSYLAIAARESDSFTTDRIVRLDGAPALNGDQVTLTAVTAGDAGDRLRGGRFRNPLALSDGQLVASHTSSERAPAPGATLADLRLCLLLPDSASGLYVAGAPLTPGLRKPRASAELLWELEAVELRARPRPAARASALEAPERDVLAAEGVTEAALRAWLRQRDLALIVTRDQTSRDRADLQQPFNLQVPGGVKTVSSSAGSGTVYEIAHFQLFQADQLRAYPDRPGRRVLARPLHDGLLPPGTGPAGSVRIAADGSTAALVPAGRALTWQSTDREGRPVVRERNWITFQAGEVRVCASCHGVNTLNQAGRPTPQNRPQALRDLLTWWKTLAK
ncbi:MAG: hypothetical protein V4508_07740 [Pseudomonadota bacterium]